MKFMNALTDNRPNRIVAAEKDSGIKGREGVSRRNVFKKNKYMYF